MNSAPVICADAGVIPVVFAFCTRSNGVETSNGLLNEVSCWPALDVENASTVPPAAWVKKFQYQTFE